MTSINIRKLAHSEMDLYRKPLLPETWSCFPVDRDIDTQQLRKILQKDLDKIRSGAEKDPFSNSINMLALDISRRLEKGKLNYSALEALIQRLAVGSVGLKVDKLKKYIGEVDLDTNNKLIKNLFKKIILNPDKSKKPFSDFKKLIEKDIFGIVLTAHPTFGMAEDTLKSIASMATMTSSEGKKISIKEVKKIIKRIFQTEQRPDKNITLNFEHKISLVALKNLQKALKIFYGQLFEFTKEEFPQHYLFLKPKFFSLHTWVGYDVDGRGDISWIDTFTKRLLVKIEQLVIYQENLKIIIKKIPKNDNSLGKILEIKDTLDKSINLNKKIFEDLTKDQSMDNNKEIKRISNFIFKNKRNLLISTSFILNSLDKVLNHISKKKIKNKDSVLKDLYILKAQVHNFGLGLARTQVRLNSSQLNNAISKEINLLGDPNDPSNKSTYLSSVSKLIEKVEPVNINFGTLVDENMNAKRYFMILAQAFKYIDSDQPIRFLIAECDYALTALTALYYAKLFNIENKIDISPLFETEKALANGHTIIETLIKNNHYKKYIMARGKICIQTGFSDAGRYLGQTAAVLSIENLQRKVAKVLHDNGMKNVQLLIFDTHGESIGRGGHPLTIRDRLEYVNCNYTRNKISGWGIGFCREISFQGGDGYQYFMNKELSYSALTRIAEYCLNDKIVVDDPLYSSPDFGVEFVNTIKQFNTKIMDDPNFATLLSVFGSNILHSTGSRAIKRQSDTGVKTLVYHPSQTRAIPQNSILQQLGMFANSLGGVGQFLRKDFNAFNKMVNKSDRFNRIMKIVEYSFAYSDIEVLKAYIDCFDPGMWLNWSTRTADQKRSENMREVANLLESFDVHWRLNKVYRVLHQEYMEIRNWLLGRKAKGRIAVGRGRVIEKEIRDELLLMHGIRVAIFHEIFLLSVEIPKFNDQAGVSRDEVIAKLIRFDILNAVNILKKIFPIGKKGNNYIGFGEPSNYVNEKSINYIKENNIFARLEALYECTRRVSSGINHFVGSVG